jgi:hypothetical protein
MEPAVVMFPPDIEPGEAIVAVVGVRPLLTKKVERITAPMWREISRLGIRVQRLAQQLARGSLDKTDAYPSIDYTPTLHAFTQPPDPVQIEAMLQDIPIRAALPFLVCAARAYNNLRGSFPICVERTVFGVNQLDPSDIALGMFEDLLEAVDRPLAVFDMVASGRLTTRQASLMQTVYPTLYNEIAMAVVDRCLDEKAANATWEPEFQRGLAVLLGVPGVDPQLRAALATPPPTDPQPQPAGRTSRSVRAKLIASKSDRLELEE